ncbi:hypothetical protein [Croceicoccus esteveae]|uniref:F0F1 ATP synthase subunit B family protein n=1 Tax=Croceicoccus esteveae TaxID=3075597 RepID=UPI003D77D390
MSNPASEAVDTRLDNAAELQGMTEHPVDTHVAPVAFGFIGPGAWVSLAMLAFIAILIWKGVPKLVAGSLDSRINAIREQLDDARTLRAEAEALRGEYAAKIANAERDAAAMLDHARREAGEIMERAQADTAAMIVRRERMAHEKIASAERNAVDALRAQAAKASAAAAGNLIAERYDARADRAGVDHAIAAI